MNKIKEEWNYKQRFEAIQVYCIDLDPPLMDAKPIKLDVWNCKLCKASGEYPGFEHKSNCLVRPLGRDWKIG